LVGEAGSDVDRESGLSDAAFLVEEGDNHNPTLDHSWVPA
jgi:hypothetical protein